MQMMMFESGVKKERIGLVDCQPKSPERRSKEAIDRDARRSPTAPAHPADRPEEEIDRWDGLY